MHAIHNKKPPGGGKLLMAMLSRDPGEGIDR